MRGHARAHRSLWLPVPPGARSLPLPTAADASARPTRCLQATNASAAAIAGPAHATAVTAVASPSTCPCARTHPPACTPLFLPPRYCIDNGAMIAWPGILAFKQGQVMELADTTCTQRYRTDEVRGWRWGGLRGIARGAVEGRGGGLGSVPACPPCAVLPAWAACSSASCLHAGTAAVPGASTRVHCLGS